MIERLYPPKADPSIRRVFDRIYDRVSRIEQTASNGHAVSALDRAAILEQARADAAQLIGAFGQPLVGDTSSDPFVTPIGTGPGTVTNVSVNDTTPFLVVTVSTATTTPVINVAPSPATGWGTPSSTLARTTFTTYAGQTVSAAYVQAEVQAIDDHIKILSQRLGALITDLLTKGLLSV